MSSTTPWVTVFPAASAAKPPSPSMLSTYWRSTCMALSPSVLVVRAEKPRGQGGNGLPDNCNPADEPGPEQRSCERIRPRDKRNRRCDEMGSSYVSFGSLALEIDQRCSAENHHEAYSDPRRDCRVGLGGDQASDCNGVDTDEFSRKILGKSGTKSVRGFCAACC